MVVRLCLVLLMALSLACANTGGGSAPAPGKARVFGTLHLVPHTGVEVPSSSGGGSYGSRRMRDVQLVDYSTPGFAVVYVAEHATPGGSAEIAIRDTRVEPRFEPSELAIGAGGHIAVVNSSTTAHLLSYPAAQIFQRVAPGERVEIDVPQDGEQRLFLIDLPDAAATLFVAPGRYAVVSTSGDYELRDLDPGALELRAWHPRFPPVARHVELAPDANLRVDLQMGVDVAPDEAPHAP